MKNIFKRFNEIKEMSKSENLTNITEEYAQQSCGAFKKSASIVSLILLIISIIILVIWKIIGILALILSFVYILGYFFYYPKF